MSVVGQGISKIESELHWEKCGQRLYCNVYHEIWKLDRSVAQEVSPKNYWDMGNVASAPAAEVLTLRKTSLCNERLRNFCDFIRVWEKYERLRVELLVEEEHSHRRKGKKKEGRGGGAEKRRRRSRRFAQWQQKQQWERKTDLMYRPTSGHLKIEENCVLNKLQSKDLNMCLFSKNDFLFWSKYE